MSATLWSRGGLALLVGGLIGALGGVLFVVADTVGAWLTIIALLGIGAGLLWLAVGFRSTTLPNWAVWLIAAAGALFVLEFLIAVLANLGVQGFGFAGVALPPLTGILLLVGAVMVFVQRAAPGQARWVLLLPAAWSLLLSLVALGGPLGSWWAVAIGDLLFALSGWFFYAAARSGLPARTARA